MGGRGAPQFTSGPRQHVSLLSLVGPVLSEFVFMNAQPSEASIMALLTGLSHLPSSAHPLVWDVDSMIKTWATQVHQQTEKIESCGALEEGATNVVKRSWESITLIPGGQIDFYWVKKKRAGVRGSGLSVERNCKCWRMALLTECICKEERGGD